MERLTHYRMLEKIGAGGMGEVYRAHDEQLGRDVAIKVLLALSDPAARSRLWREARAGASLNHPNVCQLYEIGEENGVLFIAMELLDGESLAARLAGARCRAPKRSRSYWRFWPRSRRCIAVASCIAI